MAPSWKRSRIRRASGLGYQRASTLTDSCTWAHGMSRQECLFCQMSLGLGLTRDLRSSHIPYVRNHFLSSPPSYVQSTPFNPNPTPSPNKHTHVSSFAHPPLIYLPPLSSRPTRAQVQPLSHPHLPEKASPVSWAIFVARHTTHRPVPCFRLAKLCSRRLPCRASAP